MQGLLADHRRRAEAAGFETERVSGYARGYEGMKELRPELELALIEGATGTYCMISHPKEAARKALEFFRRHPLAELAA